MDKKIVLLLMLSIFFNNTSFTYSDDGDYLKELEEAFAAKLNTQKERYSRSKMRARRHVEELSVGNLDASEAQEIGRETVDSLKMLKKPMLDLLASTRWTTWSMLKDRVKQVEESLKQFIAQYAGQLEQAAMIEQSSELPVEEESSSQGFTMKEEEKEEASSQEPEVSTSIGMGMSMKMRPSNPIDESIETKEASASEDMVEPAEEVGEPTEEKTEDEAEEPSQETEETSQEAESAVETNEEKADEEESSEPESIKEEDVKEETEAEETASEEDAQAVKEVSGMGMGM